MLLAGGRSKDQSGQHRRNDARKAKQGRSVVSEDYEVDALGREIIALLQKDARTTNKEIADRLGVSEVTVAARIRNLEGANVLRIKMQRNVRSLGLKVTALIYVDVEGRRPEDVADELAAIDGCTSAALTLSSPDIILVVHAQSNRDLQRIIDEQIAAIEGIASYDVSLALDVVKLDMRYGAIDAS
jgi:DNA-binding Lrp family transcriptional regulator